MQVPYIRQRYIFLASLLFTLGILFFLNNFKLLDAINFSVLFLLWPLILLIFGAYFLLRGRKIASYLTGLGSVLFGIVIFSFLASTSLPFLPKVETNRKSTINPNIEITSDSEKVSENIDKANLIFRSERGNFTLRGTTNTLTEYEAKSTFGEYTFARSKKDNVETVDLRFSSERFPWKLITETNSLDLKLNDKPKWNLDYEVTTTSSLDLDIGYYRLEKIRVKLSSSSAKINFEEKTFDKEVNFELDAVSASSASIRVPKNVGIQIKSKSSLSSTDYSDLKETSEKGTFESLDFSSADKKLYINLDANLSTVKIERF